MPALENTKKEISKFSADFALYMISVRPGQALNAYSPMLVTLLPMVTLFRPVQA